MDVTVECNQIGNESGNEKIQNVELEEIRCRLREAKLAYREKQRQLLKKKIRLVEDVQPVENINTDELLKLAQTIKRKNQITCEVLKAIMNTLLSNKKNIQVFLSVDGSLQALLRALSSEFQKYFLAFHQSIENSKLFF